MSTVDTQNQAVDFTNAAAQQPSSCCSAKEQETCCEPSAKSECCGPKPGATERTGCGCQ